MGLGKFFGLGSKERQEVENVEEKAVLQAVVPETEIRYEPEELPIDEILVNPFQPRQVFQEEALQELSDSVRAFGILQPLLVRRNGDKIQLIAG